MSNISDISELPFLTHIEGHERFNNGFGTLCCFDKNRACRYGFMKDQRNNIYMGYYCDVHKKFIKTKVPIRAVNKSSFTLVGYNQVISPEINTSLHTHL